MCQDRVVRRRIAWPVFALVLAVIVGLTGAKASPVLRTKSYFTLERQWTAHWPLRRGKGLPRLLKRAMEPFVPVWVQVEPGVTMLLDPEDYVSRVILERGAWESDSWAAVRQHLSRGATFVDVGAHIGYYSLKALPVVGLEGRVIAIEPNPDTVRELRDNIQASRAGVIRVEPVACSSEEGTLDLFAAPRVNTGQASLSQVNASQDGQAVAAYRVRARPLDAIVEDAGVSRVDVVKIDVEGAEFIVLKGALETLARYHPVVIVELIERQLQSMGTSSAEVVGLLTAHGYAARGTFGDNVQFDWDAASAR
jgi:FkbM family methyltransferase